MSGIYFGSLEDQVNDIFTLAAATTTNSNEPLESSETKRQQQQQQQQFNQFQQVQQVKQQQPQQTRTPTYSRATLRIPTLDTQVRANLIALNQPITLFGEGPADRRERLRDLAWKALTGFKEPFKLFPVLKEIAGLESDRAGVDESDDDDDESEEFYVPGPPGLLELRTELLTASLEAASRPGPQPDRLVEAATRASLYASLKQRFDLSASWLDAQPGSRPFSACRVLPGGAALVGDFGGRVLRVAAAAAVSDELSRLDARITAIDAVSDAVAIGTQTGAIRLLGGAAAAATLAGHGGFRIGRLAWNPVVPGLLASTGFDSTWRLWDCRRAAPVRDEVQLQEGHLDGAMAGAWHPHGALFCTGGAADGVLRVWDCRMGRAVWSTRPLFAARMLADAQFSPLQTHVLAVAGDDGRVAVNDLRMLKEAVLSIPAHVQACTGLRYTHAGRVLVSGSLDGTIKLWGVGDGRLVVEGWVGCRVMAFDVNCETGAVTTVGFDRSVKVFSNKE